MGCLQVERPQTRLCVERVGGGLSEGAPTLFFINFFRNSAGLLPPCIPPQHTHTEPNLGKWGGGLWIKFCTWTSNERLRFGWQTQFKKRSFIFSPRSCGGHSHTPSHVLPFTETEGWGHYGGLPCSRDNSHQKVAREMEDQQSLKSPRLRMENPEQVFRGWLPTRLWPGQTLLAPAPQTQAFTTVGPSLSWSTSRAPLLRDLDALLINVDLKVTICSLSRESMEVWRDGPQ